MARSERVLNPISDGELERRWNAARAQMKSAGIDVLIMQNTSDWIGGNVRWFTDIPATNGYPRTVLFHSDGLMDVVEMGPVGAKRSLSGKDPIYRGVGEMRLTPSFASINFTHEYDAILAVDLLKRRAYRNIGWVGRGAMPSAFVEKIEQDFPDAEFTDFTDEIDLLKAIKSPEEIELIQKAALLQDKVFEAVLAYIKPGLRDIDITAYAQQVGQRLDSEQGIYLGGSSPVGVRSPFVPRWQQGRTLQAGDHLALLIEVNGPGGFYTEIARTTVLGKASQELRDGFEAVRQAQIYTLSLMKPGADPREIHLAHNEYMKAHGMPPELRLYAHGQGYDMVERPLIRSDENMKLAAGMCFAVHPGFETDSQFAVICDNYMIGTDGPGPCLHQTEKKIFEV